MDTPLHNTVSLSQIYLSNKVCFIRTFITLFEHGGVKDQKAIFLLSFSQKYDFFFLVRLSSAFSNSLCLMCHLSMSQACYAGTLNTRTVPRFANFEKECFIVSIRDSEIWSPFICRCHGHTHWYKVLTLYTASSNIHPSTMTALPN